MNVSEALYYIIAYLKNAGIESPDLDAQVLLSHILKTSKHKLIIDNQKELSKSNITQLNTFVKRRSLGEPVAYITGKKEFYSIDFIITKDVLIPRPETEQLVDIAISYSKINNTVLDIGTGSGAIAVALKKNRPDLLVHACDFSNKALKIARKNTNRILGKNSIIFSRSDLFQAYKGKKFDLVLSNPPYISNTDKILLQKDILFEPENALFAGDNGKDIITRIISDAKEYLTRSGFLILEIGYYQDNYIQAIGLYNKYSVTIIKDYSHLPRIAILKMND